jgi:hypothetical protein
MQVSWNIGRGRYLRLVCVTTGAIALGALSACGSGEDGGSLIKSTIKVHSITHDGQCEDVNIKVSPVEILPHAPTLSNGKEFVTPVKLIKGEDNISCTGEAQTIPMSPGKWKLTANLPSAISMCDREVSATAGFTAAFKDGEDSCGN